MDLVTKYDDEINIRYMTIEDYAAVYELWLGIEGFAIRSIDDSLEGIDKFLRRNPDLSVVAEIDGKIVGSILCGHDGRRGYLNHVCVAREYRKRSIGTHMWKKCIEGLKREGISKATLVAFRTNDNGNIFWQKSGWKPRKDLNTYDMIINEDNIITFTANKKG